MGKEPEHPLELMRSRYAAYVLNLPDYIMRTTHPFNEGFKSDQEEWRREIAFFCASTQFCGLSIESFHEDGDAGEVTFRAQLKQSGEDVSFTEISAFEKVQGRWLYRSGMFRR